ncbi:hypothetical protein [Formosa sp. PL04]|uniref:hypothetical protein n=1 Tax=Formosa sp. PL04 TaxID=3081755 RepID=UPI002980F404|nr:hypothetical protein [Formosa sp. PL04]MDW5290905.1 hypothetical protein [Formosa sp. PL04]
MKYIKHLISFFLIFGLTVTECSIYSQPQISTYHHVSNVHNKTDFGQKYSKLFIYGQQLFPENSCVSLISYRHLGDVYSSKMLTVLKLQVPIYKSITATVIQHIFLNKTIHSSTPYPSLYIA